ncbi:protein phosphatase Slingshot homolog 3 isoform X3 [Ailuropoda melanoleuca]|uniref:protein phosphatase Slingshot homolog 3 isoform X3 n=1 Tax=Ailuropoda melanoleuca TaxID=9646 RepID=UPI000947BDF8|nr:protein phosphatase Slingshot homolog 3 isoform X3 [Ailuropoda melanoleuca]
MALVTVSRSPPASGHSTPVGPTQDQASKQKSWLQRRQSFAVLHGAVLRLQDGEDKGEAAEAGPKAVERPPGEEQPHGDQTDDGHGPQSPRKQEQSQHLHLMVELLRPQDDIRLAAQLEATRPPRLRYLLVVSTREHLSQDETVLLGVDFPDSSSPSCTLGLVLPLWSDTQVYLDGDGGFSVTSGGQSRIFKPISIQTMWATLQVLHQACEAALGSGLVPGGSALAWAGHYQERLSSDQSCVNEWMAMADLESLRPPSAEPGRPSEQVQMEQAIRAELWEVLDTSDLESVTSKEIRQALELRLGRPLQQYRDFIDNQMLLLMAQQDHASRIFPHLYLGSEWNAANLEELQRNRPRRVCWPLGLSSLAEVSQASRPPPQGQPHLEHGPRDRQLLPRALHLPQRAPLGRGVGPAAAPLEGDAPLRGGRKSAGHSGAGPLQDGRQPLRRHRGRLRHEAVRLEPGAGPAPRAGAAAHRPPQPWLSAPAADLPGHPDRQPAEPSVGAESGWGLPRGAPRPGCLCSIATSSARAGGQWGGEGYGFAGEPRGPKRRAWATAPYQPPRGHEVHQPPGTFLGAGKRLRGR